MSRGDSGRWRGCTPVLLPLWKNSWIPTLFNELTRAYISYWKPREPEHVLSPLPSEESLRALWIGQRVECEDKALSSVPMRENESVRYSLQVAQLSAPLPTSNHGTVARYNPAPIRSSWGGSFTAFRHRSQQLKDCLEHENTMSRF